MKMRVLLALVGLAIGFALPTFAQQTNAPDPQLREQILALAKEFDEAWNNNDPAALAALFTEDGVEVRDIGPIYGRDALEKSWVEMFKHIQMSNHISSVDQYSPHIIGGTDGNETWSSGSYSVTFRGENFGPVKTRAIGR